MIGNGSPHRLGPWFGGVDYSRPAEELGPDQLYEMQNCRIGVAGQVKHRMGTDPYISTAYTGTPTITGCGQHRFSSSSQRVFMVAGDKFLEDVSGTWTDRTNTATITASDDNVWDFARAVVSGVGHLIGGNGVSGDTMIKWTTAGGNIAALDTDSRFTYASWWEFWDGRAWSGKLSAGVNKGWRSDRFDPEAWGANADYEFDNDVSGVKELGTGALAFHTYTDDKNGGIWLLLPTGNANAPYTPVKRSNKAAKSGRAIASVPGPSGETEYQLFVHDDGIYKFSGNGSSKISYALDGERFWDNVNKDRLHKSHCVVYPTLSEVWFWIPYNLSSGASQTNNNYIIIYNYQMNNWSGPFLGTERNCSALIDGLPHAGGYSDGYLYNHEDVNIVDDDGSSESAIDGYFVTSGRPPLGNEQNCQWHYAEVSHDVEEDVDVTFTQLSPDFPSRSDTLVLGSDYDALVSDFTIGTSIIKPNGLAITTQVDLANYSPHNQVKIRNANANESFSIRSISEMYTAFGPARRANNAQ